MIASNFGSIAIFARRCYFNGRVRCSAWGAAWGPHYMKSDNLTSILRLALDSAFRSIFENFLTGNRGFLLVLAQALAARGRSDEALAMYEQVLAADPRNSDALRMSARLLGDKGDWENALGRLEALKSAHNIEPEKLFSELQPEINRAASAFNDHLSEGRFTEAYGIVKQLAVLVPGAPVFTEKATELAAIIMHQNRTKPGDQSATVIPAVQELAALENAVRDALHRGDLDEEIRGRVELSRHPAYLKRHSAVRLDNIEMALGRIFAGKLTPERMSLAKELVATAERIPPSSGDPSDYLMMFDRFYRLSLSRTNFDVVFGPRPQPRVKPDLTFVTSTGEPLELSNLRSFFEKNKAEVGFFTSASEEYFKRFARTYIATMLERCDVSGVVVICICVPREKLQGIVRELGIDNPRVVFCSDDLHDADRYETYLPNRLEPHRFPGPYYASVGLLTLHLLLPHLTMPLVFTGIDTVLQRGIRDMLEQHKGKSIVLNIMLDNTTMESRVVNSLVMAYPTPDTYAFANFINIYLGTGFEPFLQPGYFDQLGLLMATHHLALQGLEHIIGYFDEFDINNLMFTKENAPWHREIMAKFRFVNIFHGAHGEKALDPGEIAAD